MRLRRSLLWLLLTLFSGQPMAGKNKPPEVQDLHYGEVLFHFYQDDYFTALTHLMAAQQNGQLHYHAHEAELLKGGLQLSYGMSNAAEKQFLDSLDETTEQAVQNRIWYYLGKIAYQRGDYAKAHGILQRTGEIRDRQLAAEYRILLANTSMNLGDDQAAAATLKKTRAPEGFEEYLRINRGIALLRSGDVKGGREVLDSLGETKTDDEELRALRDRANLGLGYELLRGNQARQARKYLNRVRLNGPFAQAALLGAGWADAANGDYKSALTPWQALIKRSSFDTPVQEAQLAVPFAFEKLGDKQRAIDFYNQAIDYFNNEQAALGQAISAVESVMLDQIIDQMPENISGGWLHRNSPLEQIPADDYLIYVFADNRFQERLKDFRDLTFLDRQLSKWDENIILLSDMVDTRRLSYQQRAPLIRTQLDAHKAALLDTEKQSLDNRLQEVIANNDPLGAATSTQLSQWKQFQSIEDQLSKLPKNRRTKRLAARTRWLKGVLYWQLQAQYKDRLWKITKSLKALEQPLENARLQHAKVVQALQNANQGFAGYDKRIEKLQARIHALKPSVQLARQAAGSDLQHMALEELQRRKQRIVSYRNQARYALARNYDQLSQRPDEAP